jgi:hypothetical protein
MLVALIVVLFILWLLGFLQIENLGFLRTPVFRVNEAVVTLLDILIGLAIITVIAVLPGPLGIAAGVLFALWLLSLAGLIAIEGISLGALILLALIVGLLVYLLAGRRVRRV